MELALIIISTISLIGIFALMFIYLSNVKKTKIERLNEISELKMLLNEIKSKVHDSSEQHLKKLNELATIQNDKFDVLCREIKLTQEQSNSKINNGFELLQIENSNIQKEVKEKISEIRSSFKEYSSKVQSALNKYSDDVELNRQETNKLKGQIQSELSNILKEIKAPLELD